MRISEIDPKASLQKTQYSFPEKPTAPKPPKAPTAGKAPVKPRAKMIKPLPPAKAMVANLRDQIKSMRDRLKKAIQTST
jgi:hypothetical protein